MKPTEGVLRDAWELYKDHWRHLLAISLLFYISVAFVVALLVVTLTWLGIVVANVLRLIALFWLQGVLVKAVEDIRDGRADLSIQETFSATLPRLGTIAVVAVLASIAIAIGLLLLIVPGLVLMTWWVALIPLIVLEGRSAGEAFSRSRELVRGYAWNVFGVIVMAVLLYIATGIVVGIVLTPLADWLQSFVTEVVAGALFAPFIALTLTLLYFRLRDAKAAAAAPPPPPPPAPAPAEA